MLLSLATMVSVAAQELRSERVVSIDGKKYYLHTVQPKETLFSLSRTYGLAVEDITGSNVEMEVLKAGEVIKIPFKEQEVKAQAKLFKKHKVVRHDTLYSIAKKYGVSVDVIVADNPGIDVSALKIGSRLNIRKSEMGDTDNDDIERQLEEMVQDISSVAEEYALHLVQPGETLYSLGRKYGVTAEEIAALNGLQDGVVKAGFMLKVPKIVGAEVLPEEQPQEEEEHEQQTEVTIERYRGGTMNISMLLPLTNGQGSVRGSFVEFYQGALLALEELKGEGRSVAFNLFDTKNSAEEVEYIVENNAEFGRSNLIIGPVYERNSAAVVDFAREKGVVMVSPLATMNGEYYGNMFYQLSPSQQSKNDKLKEYFSADRNIIFISTGKKDAEMEREMLALLDGRPYQEIVYGEGVLLEESLKEGVENLFVVISDGDTDTDRVLAAISSMHNNRLARSMTNAPIKVIGNSRWLRYNNIERNLFFKLGVSLVTSYHVDISNPTIRTFDKRYMEAFGVFPTLYSYRGYDAVKLFAEAYFASTHEDITEWLNGRETPPLQVPYKFVFDGGKYVNDQWTLLEYDDDYTIRIR